jgi:hypothetical protein
MGIRKVFANFNDSLFGKLQCSKFDLQSLQYPMSMKMQGPLHHVTKSEQGNDYVAMSTVFDVVCPAISEQRSNGTQQAFFLSPGPSCLNPFWRSLENVYPRR